MAQNVTLLGTDYSAVPAVLLPKTGGGDARFTDVSDTTATAADVLNSKYFYNSNGTRTQGTATAKNNQIALGTARTSSTSMTKLRELTCAKTGTYHIYWSCTRSSTSGTFGSQLYINNTAYGEPYTEFSNHVQNVHLTNIPLTYGQNIAVYAKSRGNGYYTYVPMLVIMEA